ncbi:serine/threonine-protein kinase [Actinophytocola sp.]|uniref:serine/threonine-protein kinase n=1 Tax=Actinophytocola sp. TaxID=1872138 RepID=UPI002ED419AB
MRSGDVIASRYRLEETIGAGGMGEVWRATDLELRRVVAMKQATTGNGEETRREARIGAGLHHPNIISVFDVVTEDDRQWLVMEYLPARSLADVCRADGPIPPDQAAHIGAQIATALAAMHDKGMVHRDITPANILVTDDGTAKLADLGITAWDEVTLTGTARSGGTPGYTAPEVLAGHRATAASDLYSLGVTLSAVGEGHPQTDKRVDGAITALTDPNPAHRPTAGKAAQLLERTRTTGHPRRTLVATSLAVVAALATTFVIVLSNSGSTTPNGAAPTSSLPAIPPSDDHKLLFGIGEHLDSAFAAELVRQTRVRMLTTQYDNAGELSDFTAWRDTLVSDAYAEGFALHLIINDWEDEDAEGPVNTDYGVGCGRRHPLSPEFPLHMRNLARGFAGDADGPPLYVTVFQDVSAFACTDGQYADTTASTNYYRALMDRYLEVRDIFKEEAPNAKVAMGWQVWQASLDDNPATGAGPSMFAHFADALRASDFQSVLAKQPQGNVDQVRESVRILGKYGPVMVSGYGNQQIKGDIVDKDLTTLLSPDSIAQLTDLGLFAWNFTSEGVLAKADDSTMDFVRDVIRSTGREPR